MIFERIFNENLRDKRSKRRVAITDAVNGFLGQATKAKAIETQDLTVYYGKHRGILGVDLSVEKGEVFGFLGPNGAGKTTTQRVLMDVIRPTTGRATVFGRDCQKDGVAIRKRVGYLPGELSLYPNMKGRDFLHMIASLRENKVERSYRRQLCERLNLDPAAK